MGIGFFGGAIGFLGECDRFGEKSDRSWAGKFVEIRSAKFARIFLSPYSGNETMPAISMFYGVIIMMYYFDNQKHNRPHIHVKYQDDQAVFAIPDGELLEGKLQKSKLKLVQAWIEIHNEELMANWELAVNGQQVFKIDPLR